nr:SGNH/GDSL hydrolase family protein [uncultured Schaedlerella sp.]
MGRIDLTRIRECMRRADEGGELTIAFFGGSITQGCAASVHEKTYSYRVFEWWKRTFPKAEFRYVNAGIGGTTSHFGAARIVPDLLMYQPDLAVIDFSVNDEANDFFQETYEGILRRILEWKSKPAVLVLNHVFYDTGENAQQYHNAAADWYHVPHVSMRDTLYRKVEAGEYAMEELTGDALHPNDQGHELVAEEIIAFFRQVWEETRAREGNVQKEAAQEAGLRREDVQKEAAQKAGLQEADAQKEDSPLPPPMTENAYEFASRLTIREISPELAGFRADTEEKTGHLDLFKNGWIGKRPGDKIRFQVTASCIALQYRKSVSKPALRAKLVLDGNHGEARILDGNFEEDWGDCLYLEPILHHGDHGKHSIELEILDDGAEAAVPFYLVSLITA